MHFERADRVLVVRREKYDQRHPLRCTAADHLEGVGTGHLHIEKNHIRFCKIERSEYFFTVATFTSHSEIRIRREQLSHAAPRSRFVIGNDDTPDHGAKNTLIRAAGIRKTFHAFGRHQDVLRGVDLELAPGTVVGLIGPNGAGKTTLMSCLLGFLRPDAGNISFDGRPNDDITIRSRTGFVPERMNLGRRASGWQFLTYMARLAGVPRREVRQRSAALLERLGLARAAHKPLSEYSRGMLQRIALCQAVIHQPDFLFLDEPASGLDPGGVLLVRDLISEERQRGAIVLLNSHQLAEVEKVCDRVLFLHAGVIAREETLRHIGQHVVAIRLLPRALDANAITRITGSAPKDDTVIVSAESEEGIAAIVRALITAGADIVEVRPHTADLEQIFRGVS